MMTQRGISNAAIASIIVVLLLIGAGLYVATMQQPASEDAMMMEDKDTIMDDGSHMSNDAMMDDSMEKKDDSMMMEGEVKMEGETSFRGAVIAGSSSPLLEFNQRDYESALAQDRVVVLYFYASWCPICREEFEYIKEAFDSVTDDSLVGFRVHFNDSEVTPEMEALAREFGVAYQHTKVFIKSGERVLKSPEAWSTQRYLAEFKKY